MPSCVIGNRALNNWIFFFFFFFGSIIEEIKVSNSIPLTASASVSHHGAVGFYVSRLLIFAFK